MNKRFYELVNTYLSDILLAGLVKMESKFVGDILCWKSGNDIVIMIEDNNIKLSKKIWYELTNHFSLSVSDVHMVMVDWIKENLGINRKLTMANCSFMRKI